MRIIIPKGTPRTTTTTSTTSPPSPPSTPYNEPALPPPTDPAPIYPYSSTYSFDSPLNNTSTRGGYRPSSASSYPYDGDCTPQRRRKQSKKHKSSTTSTASTASYYNNADLDDGYNSSDEHAGSKPPHPHPQQQLSCGQGMLSEIENDGLFEEELKLKKGYYVRKTKEDGNCLFRAIADQIYGDEEMHGAVRKLCMDYMEKERDHYSQFLTEDFANYVARKRADKCFGNHLEIQALCEVYGRPIEVYHGRSLTPLNIFHGVYNTDYPPIRLSYHQGNHYNSIVDPNNPSVGVGLGLPAYKPGEGDKMQVMQAMRMSEQDDIEKALMETSRQSSEYQEIEREIEQAVLAASRAEYIASLFAGVSVPPTTTTSSNNNNNNNNNNNSSSSSSSNNNNSYSSRNTSFFTPTTSTTTTTTTTTTTRSSPPPSPPPPSSNT